MNVDNALKLRKMVKKIATSAVKQVNPPPRIGLVDSIDRENNICNVKFAGDETPVKVAITPGIQPRHAAYDSPDGTALADTVRVGGRPGAYYLMDVVSSSFRNLQYDEAIDSVQEEVNEVSDKVYGDGLAPFNSPIPQLYGANGAVVVDWKSHKIGNVRDENTNTTIVRYEIHASVSNTVTPDETTRITIDGKPPTWVRQLPNDSLLSYDEDTFFGILAYDEDGVADFSGWFAGKPRKASDEDLSVTFETLVTNNALVEAMKVVDLAVSGDFTANTLTAIGKASFRDPENELGQGSKLLMRGKTTAPSSPPVASEYVPSVALSTYAQGINGDILGSKFYRIEEISGPNAKVYSYDTTTGSRLLEASISIPSGKYYEGMFRISSTWYIVYNNGVDFTGAYIQSYNDSFGRISSITGVKYQGFSSAVSNLFFGRTDSRLLVVGSRSAVDRDTPGYGFIHEVNPATGAILVTRRLADNVFFPTSQYYYYSSVLGGNFDYGAFRYVLSTHAGVYVYASDLTRITSEGFSLPQTAEQFQKLMWDGTRFCLAIVTSATNKNLYKFVANWWTSTTRDTLWYGGTWANDVSTLQETVLGKVVKHNPKKRWAVKLTFPDFPSTSNKIGAYVAVGGTSPPTAFGSYVRQTYSGSKYAYLSIPASVSGDSTTSPPDPANNTRDFTGGASAEINDAVGGYWKADGRYKFDTTKDDNDTGWLPLTMNSGFSSAIGTPLQYRKRGLEVRVRGGLATALSANTEVVIGSGLPTNMRPSSAGLAMGFMWGSTGNQGGRAFVDTGGSVRLTPGSAGANGTTWVAISYLVDA